MQAFILRFTYSFLLRWILKLFVGVKSDKASFLSEEKQFIIVANHNSHLDTMALMSVMPSKILPKVKPVAAIDHFGKTKFQQKLSNYFINTLLISRTGGSAIKQMKQALDEGYSLIIFPEGSRGEPDEEQAMKPGVALLLALCPQTKYVPVYMTGMGKAMPKGDNLIVPYESFLYFGRPTTIQSTDKKEILLQIEQDIKGLKKRASDQ